MKSRIKVSLLVLMMLLSSLVHAAGDGSVIVDGYDITNSVSGTSLKEIYQDQFKIGVGLNGYNIETDTMNSKVMSEVIKYHFNSVTYTNLMKPDHLLDRVGSARNYQVGNPEPAVKFNSVIKGLEFCKDHGIGMRGHTLVWHAQTPDWFFREGYGSNSEYVDRDTMLMRMESYIRQVLEFVQTEYPGVVYAWDVVNEAVENGQGRYEIESGFNIRTVQGDSDDLRDNPWYKVIGPDYVEKAFTYARKYADPDVKLFYNDYNTFQTDKTQAIYKLASYLKGKGLIDGIGMQGYMGLDYPGIETGGSNFKTAVAKFGELDLELHVTELSINPEGSTNELFEKQAQRYQEVFKVLSELKKSGVTNVTNVTVFGIMDGYLLYPDDDQTTRLFDGELQPKPAFYGVAEPNKPWYVTKAVYEGALQVFDAYGDVVANLLPGVYTRADLEDLLQGVDQIEKFRVARGYVMKVRTEDNGSIYMGNVDWKYNPFDFEDLIEIVVQEDDMQNIVSNKSLEASHLQDRADRAVDGELMTSWSPNEEPPYWISADLGKPHIITRWVVYHRGGGGFAPDLEDGPLNTADFRLQISDDNDIWHDVDVVQDNQARVTDRVIAPVEAQYVRLLIDKPSSMDFNKDAVIYEWKVYGSVID